MTEDFTSHSLRDLLGELPHSESKRLHEQLARDDIASAAYKTCADGLAGFALATSGIAPLSESETEVSFAKITAALGPSESITKISETEPCPVLVRWAWPVAAAMLLGLNVWQWQSGFEEVARGDAQRERAVLGMVEMGEGAQETSGAFDAPTPNPDLEFARKSTPEDSPVAPTRALMDEYVRLQRARDSLDAEYDAAWQAMTQRILATGGASRLTLMELVDPQRYSSGERQGLVNFAKELIIDPNLVPGNLSGVIAGTPEQQTANLIVEVEVANVDDAPPSIDQPYAWSVYDETTQTGYLNLYGLPAVSAEAELQVWVRSVADGAYLSVGAVPREFLGQDGSVYYTLPDGALPPVEILVTQEPTGGGVTQPTGPTIIQGP